MCVWASESGAPCLMPRVVFRYVVLPPESTRVDMGDGIYFYPFYDILRNPLGPRASTNPDVIASGLMQVCLNFNAECEAPTSIEDALGTTTGEKTGIFNVLVKAARHPILYRNDRDLNNSLFFNRIFDPQVNALNCMRLHRPEGPPNANPAHIDYFMQPASCLAKTGERVVCAAVQEKHNAKDDGKEICLLAAPNLVVSDKCVDDLTIPEIATDRCIYSESAVQRGAKGRFAHLSLLFVIDPHYLKTAHSLMSSPILLEALVHRNGIEAGLSAFDRQLNTDPSNVTTAQRALVKTVRDRDERQTMGALDMQPNPWPEDTYSFDMFATQDRNVRIMRDQAKDVMDLLSLTRDTCIAKANDDGDFSLRTSLTHTQVGFMVHCLNRADQAALIRARDMVLPTLRLELEALRHTSSVNHLRSNAITGVQSLAAWRRRRAHESISHDTLKLKYRRDVNPKRKPVSVASTMCSSVSAEPDSALTNMVSSDLGVLQEFVAAIENELCYGVGIESISSMLAIYLLSVTLTTVRDIPSSVHLFLMGDTTTGKTIFLQLARAVLDEMGLYSQMDKETIASSCTADDRQRMVVQAYNEVNRDCWSKPVSNVPLAKADHAPNSGGGAEHANSSQAQQMMLQCVENSKYVSNIKQPTDIARVAAGGKSAFETTNQTTNKQHSLALTANTSPRHVASALLARFVAVPFDNIPRARNKTADESRMPYCRFMPALRNLIARANEWSNLITTARLLPGVDTAMVAPVAMYLNKRHMELAQKAGCIPAFRTTAAPGRTPPLETSRLKKQLMRTIESMCHARLTLTLMNTLAPTLAAVGECWDESLMNATVALCSIANVEDLSVAYGLFNNFDMSCRSMDVIKHTTNLLDNVVQAFLYCLHHKAVQYEGGDPNTITKVIPTSLRTSQPVHPIKIKSARQAARKSKVIAAMRQLPATAFREPAFAWVAQCALEWARSEHMTILVCVLSQNQGMPLHRAHLDQPQVQGESPIHPMVQDMSKTTVACAAFWYVVEQAYQVVREAWLEFRGPDASPEPRSQPLPSGAGAGAGASSSEYDASRFDNEFGEDPLAEEKSGAMDRILAFGTHLQTRSDFAAKPVLIPRVGFHLMFPLQVVTHVCITGQKDKTTFMRADVLNQTLPYSKLKENLDPHCFYHKALSGLARFTLKSALTQRRPPAAAAAAASGATKHVGDSTGRSKDNAPQELRYDATNGMDPSYLAKKVGEESGNVELDGRLLINMGVLRVSTVICDTRHLALDPRAVDNSTDTPTAAAWRQLHESLSSRTARQADGSPVPQIFDRDITVLTHRLRDTMGVTALKRIKPKENDYYEDDGVATRQHLVGCMRELSRTPPDQPLDVSRMNTRVDRGRVRCGKHDSLLEAAFNTRCTAFPVLFSAVRVGLMRVAEKHFERLNQQPTTEKCTTFVKDLFQALLFTPRDFCVKYQHLDKRKLGEYPECMPEGKAHVVPIKTAGSSMDDLLQGDVAGDADVVLGAKRSRSFNTAAYERRMQKARRATGNAASRMGSMVMERRDAQNRDMAAMMQVDAEESHQDYDDMGRPIV